MDDAKKLKEAAKPGSKAVIVGGGLIGFKAAEGLHHLGVDVTIVELADRILSTILDTEGASLVSQSLQNDGIKIITGTTVDKIIGDEYVKGFCSKWAGIRSRQSYYRDRRCAKR